MTRTKTNSRQPSRHKNTTRRQNRTLNVPRIETIPDLGVSAEAARLIRVAVWLERAVHEIDAFLEGISLKGAGCESYRDDLGSLAFDIWIAALTNITGPDKIAKRMCENKVRQREEEKAERKGSARQGKAVKP